MLSAYGSQLNPSLAFLLSKGIASPKVVHFLRWPHAIGHWWGYKGPIPLPQFGDNSESRPISRATWAQQRPLVQSVTVNFPSTKGCFLLSFTGVIPQSTHRYISFIRICLQSLFLGKPDLRRQARCKGLLGGGQHEQVLAVSTST